MNDRDLMAIADQISERLWRASLDVHQPSIGLMVGVTRPVHGMKQPDHGVWMVQVLVLLEPGPVREGFVSITVGVQEDGSIRAYVPDVSRESVFVERRIMGVLVAFDHVTDGMLSRALANETVFDRRLAEDIIAASREEREAA